MGGEKVMMPASMAFITGSPPRGRGKKNAVHQTIDELRITPAWAGKSFPAIYQAEC